MKKTFIGCLGVLLLLILAPFVIVFVGSFFNGHVEMETSHVGEADPTPEAAPVTEPTTLKLVTFNIQDMNYVSRYGHNRERMKAIAAKLSAMDPDIVGFQESFVDENREYLKQQLSEFTRLKYHAYLSSGYVGSGTLISSAYPFVETDFHRFVDSNQWWKVWEGDWWAGKGVVMARVGTPSGSVDFFNTHAQADYGEAYNEQMRKKQMEAMAAYINEKTAASSVKAPVFAVGDVNCRRGDEDYEALVGGAKLLRLMNIDSRIDHIFGQESDAYSFEVIETLPIEQDVNVNGMQFGLSDHTGYMSTIKIIPATAAASAATETPQ